MFNYHCDNCYTSSAARSIIGTGADDLAGQLHQDGQGYQGPGFTSLQFPLAPPKSRARVILCNPAFVFYKGVYRAAGDRHQLAAGAGYLIRFKRK